MDLDLLTPSRFPSFQLIFTPDGGRWYFPGWNVDFDSRHEHGHVY